MWCRSYNVVSGTDRLPMESQLGTVANLLRRTVAMCFSAEASFGSAAALAAVGAYCVRSAIRKDVRFLPLALTPVAFGGLQAAEGGVWLGLLHVDSSQVELCTAVFFFFSVEFWLFRLPFCLFY